MYLETMDQCGADTKGIKKFIETLKTTNNLQIAFDAAQTPYAAKLFVQFTFEIIKSEATRTICSIYLWPRRFNTRHVCFHIK